MSSLTMSKVRSSSGKHSSDVYIKREKWKSGYHVTARQRGRFVAVEKWKGSESTEKVRKKAWKGNISSGEARYSYLLKGETEDKQYRSMSVSVRHRVFMGSKKKRKADIEPVKRAAIEKYSGYRFRMGSVRFVSLYDDRRKIA